MEPIRAVDAQTLYRQWQDGQLLDTEERTALGAGFTLGVSERGFAEFLKSAGAGEVDP